MASLIVRQIEDEIVVALKARAHAHGRSAEAEHRALLRDLLLPKQNLAAHLLQMPDVGLDEDFERPADDEDIDVFG